VLKKKKEKPLKLLRLKINVSINQQNLFSLMTAILGENSQLGKLLNKIEY